MGKGKRKKQIEKDPIRAQEQREKRAAQQEARQEARQLQQDMIAHGRSIVRGVAYAWIVLSVLSFLIADSSFIAFIVHILLGLALYTGRNWARILFIVGSAILCAFLVILLFIAGTWPEPELLLIVSLTIFFCALVCAFLRSESVKAYTASVRGRRK